jgi:hypothetical protein
LNNYIIEPRIHLQGLVFGYFTASPIVTVSLHTANAVQAFSLPSDVATLMADNSLQ